MDTQEEQQVHRMFLLSPGVRLVLIPKLRERLEGIAKSWQNDSDQREELATEKRTLLQLCKNLKLETVETITITPDTSFMRAGNPSSASASDENLKE